MATKKVKKFGRGGDILTALGAGLAGYGAYKYFTKDDQGKDTSTGLKAGIDAGKKANEEREAEKKAPPKREEYVAADKEENAAKKASLSKGMQYKKPEGPAAVDTSNNAANAANAAKNKKVNKKVSTDNAFAFTGQGMAGSDTGKKESPVLKAGESKVVGEGELKPYPVNLPAVKEAERRKFLQNKAGLSGKGIPTPGNAKAGDKSGSTQKGRSENPIQGTIDNHSKSMARTPEQKMSEGAREVQRRRDKEKAEKLGYGIKKGGMVKKYASGGSVSSASKRADGIAIRGKTRA
jgi:hypothetical protein